MLSPDAVAKVVYEANSALRVALGRNPYAAWEKTPRWKKDSVLAVVNLHLEAHRVGQTPTPEASHAVWVQAMQNAGWEYSPTKSIKNKLHPAMVPFQHLPVDERAKAHVCCAVVAGLWQCYQEDS